MQKVSEHGTRERILAVAEASLAESGYHGTRLHDIARRVGIQKASLFHYFPSKAHLYRAVLEEGFGETEQIIRQVLSAESSPMDKIRPLVEAYVDMVAAHIDRTKILLRQSLGDVPPGCETEDPARLLRIVTSVVSQGQQARLFAPIDPVGLVLGVIGMVAFFFTSVPVFAPDWLGDPSGTSYTERVKRHVVEVVERCLTVNPAASPAVASTSSQSKD